MALKSLEEIYRAARQLPKNEQAQLLQKLNSELNGETNGHTVPPVTAPGAEAAPEQPAKKYTPDWLIAAREVSRAIRESGVTLPPDLAEQHDHYLYGRPKR